MSGSEDDRDLRAAEFVLGVLDEAEAQSVQRQAQDDPALAAAIAAWEARLAPLAELVDPVTPPAALWDRLAAAIAEPAAAPPGLLTRLWRSAALWRVTTLGGLAVAAGLAGLMITQRPAPVVVAALAPVGGPGAAFIAEARADGTVTLRASASVDVPSDRDLELWALAEGATKPVSLGVLPAGGRTVTLANIPREGTQLLVSLEPRGGSPTGQPTGPVLYGGKLTVVN